MINGLNHNINPGGGGGIWRKNEYAVAIMLMSFLVADILKCKVG